MSFLSKEEFDRRYVGEELMVHCPTEELANEFLKKAHEHGYQWINGGNYLHYNNYEVYGNNTCYNLYQGSFSNLKYSTENHYEIVEFKGFTEYPLTIMDIKFVDGNVYEDECGDKWQVFSGNLVKFRSISTNLFAYSSASVDLTKIKTLEHITKMRFKKIKTNPQKPKFTDEEVTLFKRFEEYLESK